ncbi:Taxilin family [Cinnamomum micranthum f. kanehirae]|uniref:Taxilin family n=1 Tax=Cinnamomum micranthum f. kanehirae TaxID=337451 RepID=A0A3S3NE82_9MAGN|nr:Taxilin family [Cinnamomum micranthum f. kanehirae]
MEQSPANQLPEADSLPDGFVESSTEPSIPISETEKQQQQQHSSDYKDTFIDVGRSQTQIDESIPDSIPSPNRNRVHEKVFKEDETRSPDSRADKAEKPRTFPVPLSEKGSFDSDLGLVRVEDEEKRQGVAPIAIESGSNRSNGVEERLVNSEQSAEGCTESHDTAIKEKSASESTECLKNKKLESSEVKQRPVRRSLKSEKELLELTLKYQQVIAERDAAVTVREKLESLCRELQRQNKVLMDECKRVSVEGQNLRSDLSTKFHDAIKDVSKKLEEQKDECLSQLKENEMLRNKLKHLADQYTVSEQQFQQKLKQKMLELQLADLKLQQHQEKSAQEQTQMQLYAEQVSQLLATEKNLRLQLAADGEKFQQFQDALLKTNEVFEAFKLEMEKMSKSIKDLKKENNFLKSKCEKSDVSLIELVEEREHLKKQLEKVKGQKDKLESLCRLLQAERKQNLVESNASQPVPTQVKMASMDEEQS